MVSCSYLPQTFAKLVCAERTYRFPFSAMSNTCKELKKGMKYVAKYDTVKISFAWITKPNTDPSTKKYCKMYV